MGWRCWCARRQLALLVGDDLSDPERRSVELHLSTCPACRERLASLERSHAAMLGDWGAAADSLADSSLWPSLRSCIAHTDLSRTQRRSLLPVGALVAASLAIATILWNRPAGHSSDLGLTLPLNSGSIGTVGKPMDVVSVPDLWDGESLDRMDLSDESRMRRSHFHLERALPVGFPPHDF